MTKCFDHLRHWMMKVFLKIVYTSKSPDHGSNNDRQAMWWFFHNNFAIKRNDGNNIWRVEGDLATHRSGVTFRKERGRLTMVFPFEYRVPADLARLICRRIEDTDPAVWFPTPNVIWGNRSYQVLMDRIMIEFPYRVADVWHEDCWPNLAANPETIIDDIPEEAMVYSGPWGSHIYFRTEEERLAFILSQ